MSNAHDTAHAGSQVGQAAVAEAIEARDLSDKTRAASPLALAPSMTPAGLTYDA